MSQFVTTKHYAQTINNFSSTPVWRQEAYYATGFLVDFANKGKSLNILDFGCGTGAMADAIHKRYLNALYYGVDSNNILLAQAIARNEPNEFYADNLQKFCGVLFDAVIFHHSIAHVGDVLGLLFELHGLLTLNAKIVIVTPNHKYDKAMWVYNKLTGYKDDPTTEHWYDFDTLENTLQTAGYVCFTKMYFGDKPRYLPFLSDDFRYRLLVVAGKCVL